MLIKFLGLLQASETEGIPRLVWVGAALVLLTGVSLVIYFLRRVKRTEKEADEHWSSDGKLFSYSDSTAERESVAPSSQQVPLQEKSEQIAESQNTVEPQEPSPTPQITEVARPDGMSAGELVDDIPAETAAAFPSQEPDQGSPAAAAVHDAPDVVAEDQSEVLSEEIWAELDKAGTTIEGQEARVAQPVTRERFEAPAVKPIPPNREAFEPPHIAPIVPRATSGTPAASKTDVTHASRADVTPARRPAPAAKVSKTHEANLQARRQPAGSILGLPSEPSSRPLVFGDSGKERAFEVSSLASYGNHNDEDGKKRGGTIALLAAVALVVAGVVGYLYYPPFRSWADGIKNQFRGSSAEPAQAVSRGPQLQIFPMPATVTNNQARVYGNVYNVSDETLYEVIIEISLLRREAPSDLVNVNVNPPELGARQRGGFEFAYDSTKYYGYQVSKCSSRGLDVKFTTPGKPGTAGGPKS